MKKTLIAKKLGIFLLAVSLITVPAAPQVYTSAAVSTSSQPTAEEARETLKLTTKTYEKIFKTKNDIIYKKISFAYPVAEGDSEAADTFNKFYQKLRNNWVKSAKKNLEEAKDMVKQLPENNRDRCYADEVTCKITNNDDKYISILQSGYDYSMGAHGTPYRITHIFDAKTGMKVSAADILGLTSSQLNTKIKKQYIKKFDKTKNTENFLFYPNRKETKQTLEKLDFNDDVSYIKNNKIHFYTDPYTLGSYAAGYIEVTVKLPD